jgi:hypothetical protein
MTPVANLPTISTTPAANFATGGFDGGKFATDLNNTGGKFASEQQILPLVALMVANLPLILTIPVANLPAVNLPPVSRTPAANNWNNIRLLTP